MIEVYKIGIDNYYDNGKTIDKNGGLFEYNIIVTEVLSLHSTKSILVIVNGKLIDNTEEASLLELMQQFDYKIFIATDIIAFTNNTNIINKCDCLLHQSPDMTFDEFKHLKQAYSWLPEAFYKYVPNCKQSTANKNSKIIFGGGVRNNDALLKAYLNTVPSTSFLKTETTDNRVPYSDYLNELAKHKYSLVISRQQYVDVHWVTPRYVEAAALNTLPICHYEYDLSNHFSKIKVFQPNDLRSIIEMYESNDEYYNRTISNLKDELSKNVDRFASTLQSIIGELK